MSLTKTNMRKSLITFAGVTLTIGMLVNSVSFITAFAAEPVPESNVAAADTTPPGDVENLKAIAGNGKVTLTWNEATDNVGVKGYKIYYGTNSVTTDGGSYTFAPVDVGNKTVHELTGLTNNKKYYFAVTAYDASQESDNYSVEVSATPADAAVSDTEAPKVVKAEAVDMVTVKVTFSESIKLPTVKPETSFTVKSDVTNINLEVKSAELDKTDASNKTVLLTTAEQVDKTNYILTAGIEVKDLAQNPIVSGNSDTAGFTGSSKKHETLKPAAEDDKTAPSFVEVKAKDSATVEVVFSEPVVLKADARENFIIAEAGNLSNILNVKKVTIDASGLNVSLSTDQMKAVDYNLLAVKVMDKAGNSMTVENNAITFKGVAGSSAVVDDLTKKAMQDAVKDLSAALVNMMVKLSWSKVDTVTDLAGFVLYVSKDNGKTFDKGTALASTALSHELKGLEPGMTYLFKLTSKNSKGEESSGVMTTLTLPGTGPELGLIVVAALGGGRLFRKKSKK